MNIETNFLPYLAQHGIQFRHPCPHTHPQNGRAERKHRHIVEVGLCLLAHAHMPLDFWWEAFSAAVFFINRTPSVVLQFNSPFQCIFHQIPDYSALKVFGCACFPYLRAYNTQKFDFHTTKCVFLGYSSDHKGYKCLHSSGRIYIAKSVIFNEKEFPFSLGFPTSERRNLTKSIDCSTSPLFILQQGSDLGVFKQNYSSMSDITPIKISENAINITENSSTSNNSSTRINSCSEVAIHPDAHL